MLHIPMFGDSALVLVTFPCSAHSPPQPSQAAALAAREARRGDHKMCVCVTCDHEFIHTCAYARTYIHCIFIYTYNIGTSNSIVDVCEWYLKDAWNAEYCSGHFPPSPKIIDTMLEDVGGYEQPHAKRPLLYMKTYPQHVASSQFMIFFGYLNGPKNICVSPKIRTDTYDFLDHLNHLTRRFVMLHHSQVRTMKNPWLAGPFWT